MLNILKVALNSTAIRMTLIIRNSRDDKLPFSITNLELFRWWLLKCIFMLSQHTSLLLIRIVSVTKQRHMEDDVTAQRHCYLTAFSFYLFVHPNSSWSIIMKK